MSAVNGPSDIGRILCKLHDTESSRLGGIAVGIRVAASRAGVSAAKRGWARGESHPGVGTINDRGTLRWLDSLGPKSTDADKGTLAKMLAVIEFRKIGVE